MQLLGEKEESSVSVHGDFFYLVAGSQNAGLSLAAMHPAVHNKKSWWWLC